MKLHVKIMHKNGDREFFVCDHVKRVGTILVFSNYFRDHGLNSILTVDEEVLDRVTIGDRVMYDWVSREQEEKDRQYIEELKEEIKSSC